MTEIRLAEDQMQRLIASIRGEDPKPKPEPEPTAKQILADLWRDYNERGEELLKAQQEIERLNEQIPKERTCVSIRPYGEYYELLMSPIIFGDMESALKYAEEHYLEVIE